jgi:hypothetical protein
VAQQVEAQPVVAQSDAVRADDDEAPDSVVPDCVEHSSDEEGEACSQGSGVVKPTRKKARPALQNIFEGVHEDAEDGDLLDAWRESDSGLPSAEDVDAGVNAGVHAAGVEEASQVQGKTTEVAEGGEAGGGSGRHLCVPCGRVPGGGPTPSDPSEQQEGPSTPVRSAAPSDSEVQDDDGYMDMMDDDQDMFLEDEENQSEEEQQRKLVAARANYSEAINSLEKAYANSQEFIDRLKEIGFATEGLLKDGEVASAMEAGVSSTVIVQ